MGKLVYLTVLNRHKQTARRACSDAHRWRRKMVVIYSPRSVKAHALFAAEESVSGR